MDLTKKSPSGQKSCTPIRTTVTSVRWTAKKYHGVHEPIEQEKIPCMECHNDFEFKVK